MSDEKEPNEEPANAAPNTSENIEVPPQKPPGAWEMPKPVFQKSSGYLPQGFEQRYPVADPQADVPTDEPVGPAEEPADAPTAPAVAPGEDISESPDIQPQPDISQVFTVEDGEVAAAPEKKKRSPAVRAFLVILGILAMVGFAALFLAVVYYLFFYHPNESQILN